MPRILIMYRLMSGFETSLNEGIWKPEGAPTAAHLISALDQMQQDYQLVLYPPNPGHPPTTESCLSLEGLHRPVRILSYGWGLCYLPWRASQFLAPLYRAWWCVRQVRKLRPAVFYTDRGNVLAAALVTRFSNSKTLLRVMGVPGSLWRILQEKRISLLIQRWAFRQPFSLVLGSRDGSRVRDFFHAALAGPVPRLVQVNGVLKGAVSRHDAVPPLKTVFLGRLDEGKGVEDLIEAFIRLPELSLQLTIVGYGPLESALKAKVADAGIQHHVNFTGAMEHTQVLDELAGHDIYVSLSDHAQITNSNLEAASAGLCLVLGETATGDDEDARALYGDAALWLHRENRVQGLADVLKALAADPARVNRQKARSRQLATGFLSWNQRVEWEIRLLDELANGSFNVGSTEDPIKHRDADNERSG